MHDADFDTLWGTAGGGHRPFHAADLAGLPEPARRYLTHAIAEHTPLYSAVRLEMHGEIRLEGVWRPFSAEQVIRWHRGFVWRARVSAGLFPIWGSDRLVDGASRMSWKLLGLVPVMTAAGPDITRSALGRAEIESVWLPTALVADDVRWTAADPTHLGLDLSVAHESGHVDLAIEHDGRLTRARMQRWGNPDHGAFHDAPFGAIATEERAFDGVTIPTTLKIGWHIDSPHFGEGRGSGPEPGQKSEGRGSGDEDGEFFRVTVDAAEFR